MSENEIKELKELVEKSIRFTEIAYKIIENEIKMLRYESSNKNIVSTLTINDYMTDIKCRMCGESKKVVKGAKQEDKKICSDCTNELIDDFESDCDVC